MARVFISHSSLDNTVRRTEIKLHLAEVGVDSVFLDIDEHSGIPPGADWERTLYQEIDSAHAVVLVLTPNWLESKWCFVEFAQARALGKAIFPVIVAPGGEKFFAPDIQQLDLRTDRRGAARAPRPCRRPARPRHARRIPLGQPPPAFSRSPVLRGRGCGRSSSDATTTSAG